MQFDGFPLVALPLLVTGSYFHDFLPGQEARGIFVIFLSRGVGPQRRASAAAEGGLHGAILLLTRLRLLPLPHR